MIRRTLVVVALLAMACASQPGIDLRAEWPAQPRSYDEATRAWTRHATRYDGFELLVDAHVTFKSPEWRAALIERLAVQQSLSREQREELVAQHRQAAAEAHEFQIVLSAFGTTEDNLHEMDESTWQLALVDDRGRRVAPAEVKRDRRPPLVIRSEFPFLGDFDRAYVVRFPTSVELLGPNSTGFTVKLTNPRGAVEFRWK